MSHPLDNEAREKASREEQLRAAQAEKEFRRDVQAVMALPEAQRLMWRFLQLAGVDATAYRSDPLAMAHAAGWRDAGNYWLDAIRTHCPERETQMRIDARKAIPTEKSNDDE